MQPYLAGGARRHRSKLEDTSSYRSSRRPHRRCLAEKEVRPLHHTAPTPPATCPNKMLDGILILFQAAWKIKFTYTRRRQRVLLVRVLNVRPVYPHVRNPDLVPKVRPRWLPTWRLTLEPLMTSQNLWTANWKMSPHPQL